MRKRSEIPPEERSYSLIYLICCTSLVLATIWAIADETWIRRPWKKYQKRFNQIEYNMIQAEFAIADSLFTEENGSLYEDLKNELHQAQQAIGGQEYKEARKVLERRQRELDKVRRKFQFTKSEFEELYYEYKKAQHEGKKKEYETKKNKAEKLLNEMKQLNLELDKIIAERDIAKETVGKFSTKVDSLNNKMSEMTRGLKRFETRLSEINNRSIKIHQWVLKGFDRGGFGNFLDRVDRCMSCHPAIEKPGFEDAAHPFKTHPQYNTLLATHPIKKFGCTPCHQGQGPALEVKAAHGDVSHWEHPMLKGDYVEASCLHCHMDRLEIPQGEVISTAKKMLTDAGCFGCHDIDGYYDLEKVGPDLNSMSSKVKPEWIYHWLKNMNDFLPNTNMPDFRLSDSEAEAITAYLLDISKQSNYTPKRSTVKYGYPERGKALVKNIGCRSCHIVGDDKLSGNPRLKEGNNFGPDLNKIGSKVDSSWLFDWLKDPKNYRPKNRMANMRLTDQEAMDIVAYMMTMKETDPSSVFYSSTNARRLKNLDSKEKIEQGEKAIRQYGCYGCHEIKGMENEKKLSVELSNFANKAAEELFFGDAIAKGTVQEETWENWVVGKLMDSHVYATEMVEQQMPDFGFSEENANTLAVLMKSFNLNLFSKDYVEILTADEIVIEEGKLRLRRYNCTSCHTVDGQEWTLKSQFIQDYLDEGKSESEALAFAPPSLESEGEKVQPDWLYRFIKDPFNIRPWISTRMPTFYFSDEEAIIIERYFSKLAEQEFKYEYVEDHRMPENELKAAQLLFSKDYFDCFSCHQDGDKKPEGSPEGWAPDLALGRQRLKPEWIIKWMNDPQVLQPGTSMPSYYPDAYPEDILSGDPDKQIEVIKDYLMHLGEK